MTTGIVARVMVVAAVVALMTFGAAQADGKCGYVVGYNPACSTATPKATPKSPAFDNGSNDPCVNHPNLNKHNTARPTPDPRLVFQDTDCGQYIVSTPTSTPVARPTPVITAAPTPVNGGPTPLITQPVPTVPAVILPPKSGSGGYLDDNPFYAPFLLLAGAAIGALAFVHVKRDDE